MTEKIKVWITKYALTSGMFEAEVDFVGTDRVCYPGDKTGATTRIFDQYFNSSEWFIHKNYAIERAREMRDKKIKSLEKQIEKLKKMEF